MPIGISNRAAAKLVGCSHVAIAKARKTGHLIANADGSIDRAVLLKWHADRSPPRGGKHRGKLRELTSAAELTTKPGETPIQAADRILAATGVPLHSRAEAERIRVNYDALLRKLEYDQKSGLVVLVADVVGAVGAEYAKVRNKLLAIPAEQAPQIHRLKTVLEVRDALHGMIVAALEDLTRDRAAT